MPSNPSDSLVMVEGDLQLRQKESENFPLWRKETFPSHAQQDCFGFPLHFTRYAGNLYSRI
jgi:hypothetical protein